MARKFCLVTVGAMMLPGIAAGQEISKWGRSGNWKVMTDPARNHGCFLERNQGEARIRIGYDLTDETAYITIFSNNWGEMSEGELLSVLYDLDGEEIEGEARALYSEDKPVADMFFVNPDYMDEIVSKNTMTIYDAQEEVLVAIDLGGTTAGMKAVRQCQKEVGAS